jgi:MFS transporter, putative metabolite:H+ symporter
MQRCSAEALTPPHVLDHAPITSQHLRVVLIFGAGYFSDVVELVLGGVLATVFSGPASLVPTGSLSWVLAASYIGTILGAPAFAWIADRYGRRLALQAALLLLAVSSCAAAVSPTVSYLILCRMTSGLAIGAYPVLTATYLSEVMPIRARARALLLAAGIGAVAWPATLLAAHWLTGSTVGSDAWRWICVGGGAGAALTAVAAMRLPESPRWLHSKRRESGVERAERAFLSATPLFAPHSGKLLRSLPVESSGSVDAHRTRSVGPRRVLAIIALLNALSPWSTVGFPLLSGAMLVHRGFGVTDSFWFTGLGGCGCVFGLLAASSWIDLIERRAALQWCALAMATSEILFGAADRPLWLIITGVCFTTAAGIYIEVLGVYVAEMFATQVRALGTASGWVINRLISVAVPFALLPLLAFRGGFWACCGVQASTLLISMVILSVSPAGRAGRPVS